jgi:hypothetical protein
MVGPEKRHLRAVGTVIRVGQRIKIARVPPNAEAGLGFAFRLRGVRRDPRAADHPGVALDPDGGSVFAELNEEAACETEPRDEVNGHKNGNSNARNTHPPARSPVTLPRTVLE